MRRCLGVVTTLSVLAGAMALASGAPAQAERQSTEARGHCSRGLVALTFDGGYKDFATHAFPILQKHDVPYTLYLPTAFPDGLGEAWWLALEEMIARETRISLVMDRKERHFMIYKTQAKYELFEYLSEWLRAMLPADRSFAIKDLCTRYSTDMDALSRDAWMGWDDLAKVANEGLRSLQRRFLEPRLRQIELEIASKGTDVESDLLSLLKQRAEITQQLRNPPKLSLGS